MSYSDLPHNRKLLHKILSRGKHNPPCSRIYILSNTFLKLVSNILVLLYAILA
jgi:hypothetical protein